MRYDDEVYHKIIIGKTSNPGQCTSKNSWMTLKNPWKLRDWLVIRMNGKNMEDDFKTNLCVEYQNRKIIVNHLNFIWHQNGLYMTIILCLWYYKFYEMSVGYLCTVMIYNFVCKI